MTREKTSESDNNAMYALLIRLLVRWFLGWPIHIEVPFYFRARGFDEWELNGSTATNCVSFIIHGIVEWPSFPLCWYPLFICQLNSLRPCQTIGIFAVIASKITRRNRWFAKILWYCKMTACRDVFAIIDKLRNLVSSLTQDLVVK